MRRVLWAMGVGLTIGIVITITVSWAIALNARPGRANATPNTAWPIEVADDWPELASAVWADRAFGWRGYTCWASGDGSSRGDYRLATVQVGWPLRSMEWRLFKAHAAGWRDENGPYDNEWTIASGIAVPLHWTRPWDRQWNSRRLPLLPRPFGFAANTLIVGFPVAVLAFVLGRRSMRLGLRRRAIRLALFFFLGAITSVLVSLGLWLHWQLGDRPLELDDHMDPRISGGGANYLADHLATWPARVPQEWQSRPGWVGWLGERAGVRAIEYVDRGVAQKALTWTFVIWGSWDLGRRLYIVQYGWPLPSLQSEEIVTDQSREGVVWDAGIPGATGPKNAWMPSAIVPVRPVPIAFVLNALLYGALIWGLAGLRRHLRAWQRRRKGRCERCGYDLGEFDTCPECGVRCATDYSDSQCRLEDGCWIRTDPKTGLWHAFGGIATGLGSAIMGEL